MPKQTGVGIKKNFWGRDGERKEKGENGRKESKSMQERRVRQTRQISGAVLFFKSCQHVHNVLSIPLLIYWAVHWKEQESNHTGAAEDSLGRRTEVP